MKALEHHDHIVLHTHFKSYDGLILLSILLSQRNGRSTLRDVIAVADMINHAIPAHEQLEGAINRFVCAGFISIEDGTLVIVDDLETMLKQAIWATRSYHRQCDQIDAWLRAVPAVEHRGQCLRAQAFRR